MHLCQAMLRAVPDRYINLMIVFDNEEVGSTTRQGAASTFLQDTLKRICGAVGMAEDGYHRLLAESFMISADNAHAVHPNHPEKADPTNRPYLNGGIVIKYHGSQKYTTDAVSAAIMKKSAKRRVFHGRHMRIDRILPEVPRWAICLRHKFRFLLWISVYPNWQCIRLMRRREQRTWSI